MSDDYLVAVEETAHEGQHLRMVACPIQGCDGTLGEDYDKYARHLAAEHGPEDVGLSASSPRVATDGGWCVDESGRRETHLRCAGCVVCPTVARIDGVAKLVCHCTHVDGEIEPVDLDAMEVLPDRWEFVPHGKGDRHV
jgi:hypothetical protein